MNISQTLFESTGINFLTNPLKICHPKPSFLVTKLIHVVSSCMSMKLDFSIVQAIRGMLPLWCEVVLSLQLLPRWPLLKNDDILYFPCHMMSPTHFVDIKGNRFGCSLNGLEVLSGGGAESDAPFPRLRNNNNKNKKKQAREG